MVDVVMLTSLVLVISVALVASVALVDVTELQTLVSVDEASVLLAEDAQVLELDVLLSVVVEL
jgi:hypothetical protein